MDIFLRKTHGFATGGLYTHPERCEGRFIMDAHTLVKVSWTVVQKHPLTAMIELRSARTIFNITLIGFV